MDEIRQRELNAQLYTAILHKKIDAVKDLLEQGASPNAKKIIKEEYSILYVAINIGNKEIIKLLLECGSDANQERRLLSGKTEIPLGAAINNAYKRLCDGEQADYENYQEIIEALLINGANIDRIDRDGNKISFLRDVVYSADTDTAKLLIRYTLLHNLETEKPKYITNNPELFKYWDNQVKKEIFLKNNEGIFDNMSKHDKYVVDRSKLLDILISDAKKFLKETQEKFDVEINLTKIIEYGVDRRCLASLKAAAFGNYVEGVSRMLADPNIAQEEFKKKREEALAHSLMDVNLEAPLAVGKTK